MKRRWDARPSALASAYVVLIAAYAGGAFWLTHQKRPYAGEPVVIAQIPPVEMIETAPSTEAGAMTSSTTRAQKLPDSLAVNSPVKPITTASKVDVAVDDPDIPPPPTTGSVIMPQTPKEKVKKLDQYVTVVTPPRSMLVKAPVAAITEDTSFGPLPRVTNGKRPADVYARPVSMNTLAGNQPKIVLIIGGMGLNDKLTKKATSELSGEVTFAFAPYGDKLQSQVDRAREAGHEVMLQLPMEPVGFPANDPGPRTLEAVGNPAKIHDDLYWHLSRFTGYTGVVNFMGGKFLTVPEAVGPLLSEFKRRGLNFVEDGSLLASATDQVAGSLGMHVRHAAEVIDHTPDAASIQAALNQLEEQAQKGGVVIGTGTGLEVTINTVRDWIVEAQSRGVIIVPASVAFKGKSG